MTSCCSKNRCEKIVTEEIEMDKIYFLMQNETSYRSEESEENGPYKGYGFSRPDVMD